MAHPPMRSRVLASLILICPAIAAAQAPGDLGAATLDDLMKVTITTASRRAEGAADAPAMVEVVTARQIRARGYRSLGDLLADQLGFKADIGGDQDYPSELTIQGTRGTSRLVLLLDGIRVASPTGEPLPITMNYPVHNARQVEIVYGPASALYGADAFSAVVNIISMDLSELKGFSAGSSLGEFGLFNQTASFGVSIGRHGSLVVSGQFVRDRQADLSRAYPEVFGGMQAQRSGVFETIFGPMTAAGAVSPDYAAPMSAHSAHAAYRNGGLQVSLFKNRLRASNSSGYTPDNAVYNAEAFQQNDLWVGAAAYSREFGPVASVSTVTLSRQILSPSSGYWNVYSNFRRSYKYAFGSMIKVDEQLSWKLSSNVAVTTGGTLEDFYSIPQGADLNAPIQSHRQPGTILDTNIVDEFVKMRYRNAGGFVQVQYSPTPRLAVTLGSRADYNTRFGGTFTPRVGVVAKATRRTTMKALFGTAYLAPSPYQASAHYGSFYSMDGGQTYVSDYWHVGNPDLKPQKKSAWQGVLEQSLSPVLNVSASVFQSRVRDIIKHSDPDRAGPGTYLGWPVAYIDSPVNEGRESIYGGAIDLAFLKSWSGSRRLSARAGLTLVDGFVTGDDDGDVQIGAIAPLQFRAGTEVELGGWIGAARVMAFGRQRLLATTEADGKVRQTLPGFFTVNVNLRRNRIARNVDAFVSIDNLFDARYYHINERAITNPEELVGAPQSPRRVTVGFDIRIGK